MQTNKRKYKWRMFLCMWKLFKFRKQQTVWCTVYDEVVQCSFLLNIYWSDTKGGIRWWNCGLHTVQNQGLVFFHWVHHKSFSQWFCAADREREEETQTYIHSTYSLWKKFFFVKLIHMYNIHVHPVNVVKLYIEINTKIHLDIQLNRLKIRYPDRKIRKKKHKKKRREQLQE